MDVANRNKNKTYIDALKKQFKYLITLFGDTKNIGISTDDVGYEAHVDPDYYLNSNHFPLERTAGCVKRLLNEIGCTKKEINNITYLNYESKILNCL